MKKKSLIIFIILVIILIIITISSILVEKEKTKDKVQIKDNVSVAKINDNIIDTNIQEDIKEYTNEVNDQNNILEEAEVNQIDMNTYQNEESNIPLIAEPEKSNVENNQEQDSFPKEKEVEQQTQQNVSSQEETSVENNPQPQQEIQTEQQKMCIDGGDIHILGDGENEYRIL